jgi:hypothetical protein
MADANEIAFSALLERIGFDANTRAYIVAQGFTTVTTFDTLPFSLYDEMLKNIMKVTPRLCSWLAAKLPIRLHTLLEGVQDVG